MVDERFVLAGYTINTRGRYKCDFCDHSTYKRVTGIENHLEDRHLFSWKLAKKDAVIKQLKDAPPKIEYREKVVYRDPPTKTEPVKKFWNVSGVYCSNCKVAARNVGIPVGQTMEETPHSCCGTRSLMLVTEFQ